jgi:hypothetical protein
MKSVSRLDRLLARLKEYREWVQLAEAQTGKSLLTQAREILELKRAGGGCGITEYYWFKLYDASFQWGRGAPDFLGMRLEAAFNWALNPRHAVLPAWDKVVFLQLASAAGLPVPIAKASFHRAHRLPKVCGQHLNTLDDAGRYLRDSDNYPLFAKPAFSQQGIGSTYLANYDGVTDSVVLIDGERVPVVSFVERLVRTVDYRYHRPECGFLFQQPLRLAPEIEQLTAWSAICGVRIICLNTPDGIIPLRAVWKVTVPPNSVDNFHMGAYGNLVADVDVLTGEVGRVVNGFWPHTQLIEKHPQSGVSFSGFRLPGWNQLLQACRDAGPVFPLMKVHHWDFALTDSGPVILELNDMGGTQIVQLHGRGLLNEKTRAFLKQHADRKAHPWVNDL